LAAYSSHGTLRKRQRRLPTTTLPLSRNVHSGGDRKVLGLGTPQGGRGRVPTEVNRLPRHAGIVNKHARLDLDHAVSVAVLVGVDGAGLTPWACEAAFGVADGEVGGRGLDEDGRVGGVDGARVAK